MKNKSKNKILLIVLSIFLILAGSYTMVQSRPGPAPGVSFKTIGNKTIALKDLQGKVVLLTFWASNCPSCLKEIADFKSLYQDYHQEGLEIIAIAMYYDRPNIVVDTSKAYQIPYDIVLDLDMNLATAFGDVSLTPTTFLLNPKGEIVFQTTGTFDLKAMQKRIESMQ
ncbi:MAG: redoxin domain-containing protein [Methyloprofundus sp.]|nr:redoxin domain-containing protein [Methyloprofundus sp.]